jgi:3'(2'), 5'-bisphosphate nucleotidase
VTLPLASWLPAIETLAHDAGERIMAIYSREIEVSHKDDASPLTQADLAAHRHIAAGLAALTPEIPLLSEEGADTPFETRRRWARYWLVDPLDGTKEFIKRNGEFTVNIALIEGDRPILGVVHAPALSETYAAAEGLGASRLRDGQRQPLRTRAWPSQPAVLASRSHADARTDALLAKLPPHALTSKGSSLKFCLVAAGEADLYPRLGPTSEWDTAAAQCVVEQAGGAVLRWPDLVPLPYNRKDSLLNPEFLVVGDRAYDWAALAAGS